MPPSALADAIESAFVECCNLDASLGERLDALTHAIRSLSPPLADAVEAMVERLQVAGVGANAPQVGDTLPPFILPDDVGRLMSLDDGLSRGPVAVVFHRGAWCPYCRISTRALAHAQSEIKALGGQIIAVVPDRQQFSAELKGGAQAEFPILTDLDNAYALSLNLSYWLGEEIERHYRALGCDVSNFQSNNFWIVPTPATFIVGQDGLIRMRFVDPDFRKRPTIDELIAAFRTAR